ncbi:YrhA family protein, partial [Alkalihalophilus marmarensis]
MTPWKDLLVKIKKIEKKYGSSLKKRASPTEIIKMNQGIQLNFGNMVLPDSYERFLKTINGLNFNELVIYGVDKGLLDNELNEDMHGFIESNEL